jgi:hypothetical protein
MHGNASGCMQHHVPRKAIWKYLQAGLTTRASLDQPIIAPVAARTTAQPQAGIGAVSPSLEGLFPRGFQPVQHLMR